MLCTQCEFDNPDNMRFCGGCGRPLGEPRVALGNERRHLTVMFCDLVESTVMAERLDPEDMLDIIQRCQSAVRAAVSSYDGYIAQYLGDGLMVYFGFPTAHEDSASRAVRAALEIQAQIAALSIQIQSEHGFAVLMRIGIHAGVVVTGQIGSGERTEQLATGSVPNIAARVQAAAGPGEVLLSEDVQSLIDERINCESIGTRQLKGRQRPMEIFRATGLLPELASVRSERSHFIGREEEMDSLLNLYQQTLDGTGQVVFLSGEAGIGKSRLLRELASTLRLPNRIPIFRCAPYHQHSPFFPLLEVLPGLLGISLDGAHEGYLDHLVERLSSLAPGITGQARLLAEFLTSNRTFATGGSPAVKRRETLLLIKALLLELARGQRFLAFEDVHWADPSTLEVVRLLAESVHDQPVLMVCLHRPTFEPGWETLPHQTRILIQPLPAAASLQFIVRNKRTLSVELQQQILERADGVPLFLEELCRSQASTNTDETAANAIPASLRDSLTSRLDALGPHKEIVQIGALIGRRFSTRLILQVTGLSSHDIAAALRQAAAVDLIAPVSYGSQEVHTFRHALIQEIAYDSLVKQRRRHLHGAVADALERSGPQRHDLLALHLERAERYASAASAWQQAGKNCLHRSSYEEAYHAHSRALEMLDLVPLTDELRKLRYDLLLASAQLLTILRSYTDEQLATTYELVRGLVEGEQLGVDAFSFYAGYWGMHATRCDIESADRAAANLDRLARQHGGEHRKRVAAFAMGANAFYLGDLHEARSKLRTAIFRDNTAATPVSDSLFIARLVSFWCESLSGNVAGALELISETIKEAERSEDPFALVQTLCYVCVVYEDIDVPPDDIEMIANQARDVSERYGITEWLGYARMHQAYVRGRRGEASSLPELQAIHGEIYDGLTASSWAHSLQTMALAQMRCGHDQDARQSLERAIAICKKQIGRFIEPECHRLLGELNLASGNVADAVHCFRTAYDMAQRDGAFYLAMRALTSLLQHDSGSDQEGLAAALMSILETEITGDTPHIRAARELLRSRHQVVG